MISSRYEDPANRRPAGTLAMGARQGKNRASHRPERAPESLDADAISHRRAECMREIERLRAVLGPTPFVDKAHRLLLPRYWAAASWKGRADILKTVEWLIALSVGVGL
ncbi:MAG TPA: hypothetical protein VN930_10300 [Xanthobacteraceae bacterium]|nr:hypothetical protein [Xanthobacteraceae bacterium]